ncbi:hypothetical protein VTI28DRAFT_5847 [Corynascus sepedonium]
MPNPTEASEAVIEESVPLQKPSVQIFQTDVCSRPGVEVKDSPPDSGPIGNAEPVSELRSTKAKPVVLENTARLWDSSVHLLPLGLSIFLVVINVQRWYWFSEEDAEDWWFISSDSVFNLLQFAAKVHELLIIASLAALTLKLFKRRLVDSRIPFGLLTGAYRVGDIPYIFSRSFYGAAWGGYWPLALILFVNTILATLVGPSSAILMVPDQDWYPLPRAFSKILQPRVYYDLRPNETWPRVVGAALPNETDQLERCKGLVGWYAYWCPAAAYSDLWNWVRERAYAELDGDLTSQDPTGRVRRRLAAKQEFRGAEVMTTISLSSLVTTGRFLSFIEADRDRPRSTETRIGTISETPRFKLESTQESTIFQPLVQTQCEVYNQAELSDDYVPFYPTSSLRCLGDANCENMLRANWYVGADIWRNVSYYRPRIGWTTSNASETSTLRTAAIFPYRNGTTFGTYIVPCTIIAHWMPATLSISPGESDFVTSNVTEAVLNDLSRALIENVFDRSIDAVGPAISMAGDWVEYLFPTVNVTLPDGTIQEESQLTGILEPLVGEFSVGNRSVLVFDPAGDQNTDDVHVSENVERTRRFMQKIYGTVVTEGLARVASRSESWLVRSSNATALVAVNIRGNADTSDTVFSWPNGTLLTSEIGSSEMTSLDRNISTPQEILDSLARTSTLFDFAVARYGYGSGKVGPTMTFALAVIYTYFIIVAAYFVHVTLWPRLRRKQAPYTIVRWHDVADLIVLAWNSRPGYVPAHNGLGVNKEKARSKSLNMRVGIRADHSGQAQLVIGEAGLEKLKKNVPYH